MKTRTLTVFDRIDDFITAFNLGLHDQHALELDADGRVTAGYFNSRLSSVFQPVREAATGRIAGHEGLIRCFGSGRDAPTSPWGVFALAGHERDLVDLDRLCRTLHMLNYFRQAAAGNALFLNIDLRLLGAVQQGFGRAFEARLRRVGLDPRSIVIELPVAALSRRTLLLQAITDYQSRGYRVAVSSPDAVTGWPTALRRARPDIVKVPVGAGADEVALSQVVRRIHDSGAKALAERLETPEQAARARAAGFDHLQGYHVGLPEADVETSAGFADCPSRRAADVPGRFARTPRRHESAPRILIVPGLHGSGPGHWQSLWQQEHPAYGRVVQDDWETPDLDRWAGQLGSAIREQDGPVVLVAHSFGALTAVRRAALDPRGIAGALLVAPANPDKFDVTSMLPTRPLPFPAVLVASENDPWMPLVSAGWWAQCWGARFVSAGAAGHINTESGHGDWPLGLRLLDEVLQAAGGGERDVTAGARPGPVLAFSRTTDGRGVPFVGRAAWPLRAGRLP